MQASNIMVIGDDINLLRVIRRFLAGHGYDVTLALEDKDACDFAAYGCYDLNILDLDFTHTEVDGLALCHKLRKVCQSPILVLAERGNKDIRTKVLNGIADGFLEKPFSMELFMSHVRAKLRLWSNISHGPVEERHRWITNDIFIDPDRHEVRIKGDVVHLTPTEFNILYYLARNEGRVVSHRELLQAVWGEQYGEEREYLRVYISQLRKKIEEYQLNPRYLLTEPSIGYRFVSEAR
jgi:two-component system KDP operon response regulator KdpE